MGLLCTYTVNKGEGTVVMTEDGGCLYKVSFDFTLHKDLKGYNTTKDLKFMIDHDPYSESDENRRSLVNGVSPRVVLCRLSLILINSSQ